MGTSVYQHGSKTHFEPLTIDFEIPEYLQGLINDYLKNLNEEGGNLADCYEEEIRYILNECMCDDVFSESQNLLLRNYYCRGGIYDDD